MIRLVYKPADNPGRFARDPIAPAWRPISLEPFKEYRERKDDGPVTLGYTMPGIIATEDATLLDSLGPIADRENENLLPMGDYGVVALRNLYMKQVDAVRAGRDPLGTIRDAAANNVIVIPAYETLIPKAEGPKVGAPVS
jgi:hypothetical protein